MLGKDSTRYSLAIVMIGLFLLLLRYPISEQRVTPAEPDQITSLPDTGDHPTITPTLAPTATLPPTPPPAPEPTAPVPPVSTATLAPTPAPTATEMAQTDTMQNLIQAVREAPIPLVPTTEGNVRESAPAPAAPTISPIEADAPPPAPTPTPIAHNDPGMTGLPVSPGGQTYVEEAGCSWDCMEEIGFTGAGYDECWEEEWGIVCVNYTYKQ